MLNYHIISFFFFLIFNDSVSWRLSFALAGLVEFKTTTVCKVQEIRFMLIHIFMELINNVRSPPYLLKEATIAGIQEIYNKYVLKKEM